MTHFGSDAQPLTARRRRSTSGRVEARLALAFGLVSLCVLIAAASCFATTAPSIASAGAPGWTPSWLAHPLHQTRLAAIDSRT